MPFTDEEKVKIRHHLGYLNVQEAATFALGVPAAVETQHLIEGAMNKVLPAAIGEARRHIQILDGIETQLIGDLELLAITQIGEISVRQDEMKALRKEYQYWRQGLANLLGTYPNPFDKRYSSSEANVPVRH